MEVITPKFRGAFVNVFKARLNKLSDKEEYSIVALFDKKADLTELKKAEEEAIIERWGAKKEKWPANLRRAIRAQSERAKEVDGKKIFPDGYTDGAFFLNLKSKERPRVVNNQVKPILDDTECYSGAYYRATVRPYTYDHAGNRGVAFGLGNLQKMADGDPLTGRPSPEESFTAVEVEDTDEAFK